MTHPSPSDLQGQVLPFRPRGPKPARTPPPPDLGRFEQTNEPDDFRHRMTMNCLGLAVTLVLIAGGLWIVGVMVEMRKNQDCVLTGRPGCTQVAAPILQR